MVTFYPPTTRVGLYQPRFTAREIRAPRGCPRGHDAELGYHPGPFRISCTCRALSGPQGLLLQDLPVMARHPWLEEVVAPPTGRALSMGGCPGFRDRAGGIQSAHRSRRRGGAGVGAACSRADWASREGHLPHAVLSTGWGCSGVLAGTARHFFRFST